MSNRLRRSKLQPSNALAITLLLFFAATPGGFAQLALPGAIAPAPEGSVAAPADAAGARPGGEGRVKPLAPKLPSEDAIVGQMLYLDGSRSAIEFQRSGDETQVARLTLSGDRLSRSGETCSVDVAETPLQLQARGSRTGLRRYQLDFPACPFFLEVLDGAVLVTNDGKACELEEADCRTDPAGLWGMATAAFDPKRANDMLGTRARVEQTIRNDFKALYEKTRQDQALRTLLVREQAGFSSWREEICRSYGQEAEYGYCALRVTEARALALAAQLAKGFKKQAGSNEATGKDDSRGTGKRRSR
ncbi:MAG: hypothetical protein HYS06_12810 [Methylocystis sp.]|nr:hypothetical protein [Methylocystis sp.]MBI3276049.1 hypothetical protein [Methylocystis sp.]